MAARTSPEWDSQIICQVKEMLQPGQRVLDAGCGYGRIAIPLAVAGFEVTGVDVSEVLLAAAHDRATTEHASLTLLNESMCEMSLPADQFDVVLCLWSAFYHLLLHNEQLSSIREFSRVLRPGGWALVEGPIYQEPTPEEIASGKRYGQDYRISADVIEGYACPHFRHDPSTLESLMTEAGIPHFSVYITGWPRRQRQFLRIEKRLRNKTTSYPVHSHERSFARLNSVGGAIVRPPKEITMTEEKWLDEYSGQTTNELIALEGEYRTDSIVLAFEQALDQKADRMGPKGLTEEERVILAIEALEREVNNGGYDQFFINSSREYAPIIVDALTRLGCAQAAELTQRAIGLLGIEGPITGDAIDRVMEDESAERDDRLGECDKRYDEVAGDLAGPLLEFIKSNRDKIDPKHSP